jgi:uncharacterized protein
MLVQRLIFAAIICGILFLIDLYVFQAVRVVTSDSSPQTRKIVYWAYWGISAFSFLLIVLYNWFGFGKMGIFKGIIAGFVFVFYISKIFAMLFVFIDDVGRLGKWIVSLFEKKKEIQEGIQQTLQTTYPKQENTIPRSEFLAKTALIAGTVPLVAMSWGIISGAHDYRVRRKTVYLPNLPKEFDGLRLAQVSDIHSGSFFNKTAVKGGVEMLMAEKPDLVFFTGDLVNNEASEVNDYIPIFEKIKADLGVFSVLGNHDYGDYVQWESVEAKRKNLSNLMQAHKQMNWQLLNDEHKFLNFKGEKLAILGVQNWGTGRFPKYGNLAKAHKGTEEAAVKLLLSHDPSHWDEQIRPQFSDIDITFAGHTHGMQFGVEIGNFRWSPVKYRYKQWADLYQEGSQYLYVNRGYGYIGFPGRVGILPEITIMELKRGKV